MDVDAQDVIDNLASKIGSLETQNAVLRAQINAYQKQENEASNESNKGNEE